MIVLTGSSGFIGSRMASYLRRADLQMVGLDLRNGPTEDIRDLHSMCRIMRDSHPDLVVHMAALTGVGMGDAFPEDYYDTNVKGTANVLEAAYRAGCRKAVVFSSASVYGYQDCRGYASEATKPKNHYGASKLAMEGVCAMFRARGMEVAVVRPFTVFGDCPREDGVFGLWMDGKGTVRSEASRGFTHVDDLIAAVMLLVKGRAFPTVPVDVSGVKTRVGDLPYPEEIPVDDSPDNSADRSSSESLYLRENYGWSPRSDVRKWLKENLK